MGAQRNFSPADGVRAHTTSNGFGRATVQASPNDTSNRRFFKKGDKVVAQPKFATDPEETRAFPSTNFCAQGTDRQVLKQLELRALQDSRRLLAFGNLEKKYLSTTTIVRFLFLNRPDLCDAQFDLFVIRMLFPSINLARSPHAIVLATPLLRYRG